MRFTISQLLSTSRPVSRLVWAVLVAMLALSISSIRSTLADESGVPQPLVVLRQTGGFAGISETTTVWDDGRVERTRNQPPGDQTIMRLAGGADDANALRASIEATGLPNLPGDAGRGGVTPCCDRITTTLTLTFTIPPQEFQTYDAGTAPAALTDSMKFVYDAVQAALVLDADSGGSESDLEPVPDDVRR